MKKDFLSALAGIFGVKSVNEADVQNGVSINSCLDVKSVQDVKHGRNDSLYAIYRDMRYGNYPSALERIHDYQCNYGRLNGDEAFTYETGWFDGPFFIEEEGGKFLLQHQSPMTLDFFKKTVAGKMTKEEAEELKNKYEIQRRLLDAWERGDLIEFHEIVTKEGADVGHVYQGADFIGQFTLFGKVKGKKESNFYKYFVKNYNNLPEVKAHIDREQLVRQLTA